MKSVLDPAYRYDGPCASLVELVCRETGFSWGTQVIAIIIFVLTALSAVGFFILAWEKWREADPKFGTPRWRSVVAFIGLCSLSAQGLLFATMDAYGRHINGWSHNYSLFNVWGRVDFYLFVVILLAAVVGKGRFRPWMFLSSLAISGVWFMIALSR